MNVSAQVLVVEDDDTLREALCDTIEFGGYRAVAAENGNDALSQLESTSIDMIISDVQMDGMDGHHLLREVRTRSPQMPFVMITAHGSVKDAVSAMRDGATDYLLKPFEAEVLLDMVSRMDSRSAPIGQVVAEDPSSKSLYALAERVADSEATVLISGESGSGKEMLARFIHENSPRANQPFLAVNCAAIPENMLESMLFGYEKGAYTGAHQARAGKFEQANGGTLLLDEVSEMDMALQAKLLRVLQEREVERLGGSKLIQLDVRVIATTNRQLEAEVQEGNFREDLYYRLNVMPMHLPPLRERPGDILPLAYRFLNTYSRNPMARFTPAAEAVLMARRWRGNARELENCVQRAAILARADDIDVDDLNVIGMQNLGVESAAAQPTSAAVLEGDLKQREQELIVQALELHRGSKKDAAEHLGISPRTLRYKLARLREQGVDLPAGA